MRISLAIAAETPGRLHALFKAYETAIRAALATVVRTPRIVLGLGACSNADDADANSQHEQQEPHSRLLGWPLSYKCPLFVFIPGPRGQRGEAAGVVVKREGMRALARSF